MKQSLPVSAPSLVIQKRRIGSGLLWGQIGRVLEIASSLAFSILVVRVLGPQDYGAYSVLWSIIGVGALIASAGYSESLTRYLPALRHEGQEAADALTRHLLQERVLISLVVGLGVWLLAAPLAEWTRTPVVQTFILSIIALLVVQGVWDLLVAYYTANLRLRDHAIIRLVSQMASVGLAAGLFFIFGVGIGVPLVAMLIGYLVSIALYLAGASQTLRAPRLQTGIGKVRRFGAYVWLTNLATFGLANQIDVLLIAALLSDATEVSHYNVAAVLIGRLYSILTGWTAIMIPAAAEAQAAIGERSLARSFDLYMKINLTIIVPALLFALAWSNAIIESLFGEVFLPSAFLLKIFAGFGLVSALAGANISHPLLYVAERQRTLLGFRIAAGTLNVVLDVILIPIWGAAGAVIGTSISNLTTHVAEFWLLRRLAGTGYPVALAGKVLVSCLLAAAPALLIPQVGWPSLAVGASSFGLLFVLVIWRLRPFSPSDYAALQVTMPRLAPYLGWLASA